MTLPRPSKHTFHRLAGSVGLLVLLLVAIGFAGRTHQGAVALTAPEVFLPVIEEAETCDSVADGVPTDNPGQNGCTGMQPPVEPEVQQVIDQDLSLTTTGNGTPNVAYPVVPNTPGNVVSVPEEGSPVNMATQAPSSTSAVEAYVAPMRPSAELRAGGSILLFPRQGTGGLGEAVRKPATVRETSSAGGSGKLFDFQPNSVVQGLDILEYLHHGSVSTGTRRLQWGEIDLAAPGVTSASGLTIGRRYFSGLSFNGVGSTGVRWVHSLTERLIPRTTAGGASALQHFDWDQPYNDPDHYYVETAPGTGVFVAPDFVGGTITKTGNSYELVRKNGCRHFFVQQGDNVLVTVRRDPFGNEISFVYTEPVPVGGDAGPAIPSDAEDPASELPASTVYVTDSRGVVYTLVFDGLGYLLSVSNAVTGTITYSYATVGANRYLETVTYPPRTVMKGDGIVVSSYSPTRGYAYNANGRLEKVYDDEGVVVLSNTYDAAEPSKIETQTDGTGAVYTFSEPVTKQTDVLMPLGWKRTYIHNGQKQCVELQQYVANFAGRPQRSKDKSLHYTWTFTRGHSCNCGPITGIVEPDGGVIELTYGSKFNLTQVKKLTPSRTQWLQWNWTYDGQNRVTTFVPPEGNASANPALHTTTIARTVVGGTQVTTRSIPARDWRTTPSVWTEVSDGQGRVYHRTATSHDGSSPSFQGKWTFHSSGPGKGLVHQVYMQDAATVSATITWDAAGRIVSITDDANRVYTCSYDPEGRPLAWTAPPIHATNQVYSHEWLYDGNGRTKRLRWRHYADPAATSSSWIEWTFHRDPMGQLLERHRLVQSSPSTVTAVDFWEYDLHGNVVSATDSDGLTVTATFDERDLPWTVTDGYGTPDATSKTYDYDLDGRLAQIVENVDATRIVRFTNEYDGFDRLIRYRIRNHATPTVQAGYVETDYEAGSRIAEMRTFAITTAGTPRLVDKKSFAYDDYHTSPTRQTSYAYDLATGVQLRSVQSDFEYGATGRILREFTENTLIAQYTYQTNGLPKTIEDLHGNRQELTWDQYGRALTESHRHRDFVSGTFLQTTRTFVRDAFGRATTISDSGTGVANQSHLFEYDSGDRVVRRTGPDGSQQTFQYRFDGLVVRADRVVAGATVQAHQTDWTKAGRRAQFRDDRNEQVDFVYDGRGRLKQEVYPDGSSWTNLRNAAGLLTKLVTPTGRSVEFSYDWRGMQTGAVHKAANGTVVRTDVVQIDLGGFVKRLTKTENGVTQYVDLANDSTGRVLAETTVVPGLPTTTVQFGYDGRGRLTHITGPSGWQHVYDYDDRNRVGSVELHADGEVHFAAGYSYLGAGGAVRRRITGDGNTMLVGRDGHGRITSMLTNGAASVSHFQYGYDLGNRVEREFRAFDGKGDAYWYDGLGRLTKVTRDSVDPVAELASGGTGTTPHAFRRVYNLTDDAHRTSVVKTPMGGASETTGYAPHPKRHHYTSITPPGQAPVSRSFDLDGRVTAFGSRTFHYDSADNLVEVKDAGVTVGKYTFDALGRRTTRTANGVEHRQVHAGPWLIEEYSRPQGSGVPFELRASHVHGPGIDSVVMTRYLDLAASEETGQTTYSNVFLHTNRIGSVTELTSQSGAVVERYRYDEYGKPAVLDPLGGARASSQYGNTFLFTGREFDAETGLYHYRARAYDPETGGFLQEDPLGLKDGINVVAYVHANPVNLVDPYGTDGLGDMIQGIMDFVQANRALIADILVDLLGPLEGILNLISAATGKDITGWVRGGMQGEPEAMGWWDRTCAAASAAMDLAAGSLKLIAKLKDILGKIQDLVKKAADKAGDAGRWVMCKATGGCFLAGTLVAMSDGSFVPIEGIDAGCEVRCEVPGALPGLPGSELVRAVTDAGGRVYEGAIITVVVARDGVQAKVSGTPEHPFWCVSRHEWVALGSLAVGDRLDGLAGDVEVVGREVAFGRAAVFNFTVEQAHSYRVSELGVLVHNGNGCDEITGNLSSRKFAAQVAAASGKPLKEVEERLQKFRFDNDLDSRGTFNKRRGTISGTTAGDGELVTEPL